MGILKKFIAQQVAKEAKFLCSLFARVGTSTTRGLRNTLARIRRGAFAYPGGAESINDSQRTLAR
jgi:hypothetical protein